jgi:hypothetical protein
VNIAQLKARTKGRLAFFAPASAEQIQWLKNQYADFSLSAYVSLLQESNGIGELFTSGAEQFVHNMLLFSIEEALQLSGKFGPGFLVVGGPGADGILYGLKPNDPQVFAYLPIDQEFLPVASSIPELPAKWLANELHF